MIKSKNEETFGSDDSTLIESVTSRIREAIINGDFTPGSRLVIADLVKRLSVSPMPVREALRRLEGEGLVEAIPNRGATVRRLDSKVISDLYEIRGALEALLVSKIADSLTLADLDALEAIQNEFEAAVSAGSENEMMEVNIRFHTRMNELGHNREVERVLRYGNGLVGALRKRYGIPIERALEIAAEHRALLRALRRGDGFEAANIARMHAVGAKKNLIDLIEQEKLNNLTKEVKK